jgi:hypothetical protein
MEFDAFGNSKSNQVICLSAEAVFCLLSFEVPNAQKCHLSISAAVYDPSAEGGLFSTRNSTLRNS